MICYRDTTFCASKGVEHTCGREFTEEDAKQAEKWWGGKDYPVAYSYFCKPNLYDFKEFVKKNHDIAITPIQEKMFEALMEKKTIFLPKASGKTLFNKLAKEYLDGWKTETGKS